MQRRPAMLGYLSLPCCYHCGSCHLSCPWCASCTGLGLWVCILGVFSLVCCSPQRAAVASRWHRDRCHCVGY